MGASRRRPAERASAALRRLDPGAVLIAIVALGATLWRLGEQSFWLDEGISTVRTRQPWHQLFDFSWNAEPNFALWHYAYRLMSYLLPDTEFGLRLPSAIALAVTGVLLYLLLVRYFDRATALLASLALVLNPFALTYGREARPYTLVMAVTVLSWYLVLRWADDPGRDGWWWWVWIAVCAVALHLYCLFMVPAQLTVLAARGIDPKRLAKATGLLAGVLLPYLLFVVTRGTDRFAFIRTVSLDEIRDTFVALGGQREWLAFVLLAVAGVGVVGALMKRRGSPERRLLLVGLAWLLGPMIVAIAFSELFLPVFNQRYLTIALPAVGVLVAVGLRAIPGVARLATGLVVVVAVALPLREPLPRKEDWRGAIAYVVKHHEPGDSLTAPPFGTDPARYYLYRYDAADDIDYVSQYDDEALAAAGSLWIATWEPRHPASRTHMAHILDLLRPTHRRVDRVGFYGVGIMRFEPR